MALHKEARVGGQRTDDETTALHNTITDLNRALDDVMERNKSNVLQVGQARHFVGEFE